MTDSRYLTVEEVAARLNTSTSSIWRWKRAGTFPKAKKLGPGVTRWLLDDVEAWETSLQTCYMTALDLGDGKFFSFSLRSR